jgi:membrane associated rhomboid family serine protease
MVIVPYRTTAELYYRPYTTVALIAATVLFSIAGLSSRQFFDSASMEFTSIRPLTWFTHMLLHKNVWHMLGNVVLLWIVGHVLEGRFGTGRFLGVVVSLTAVIAIFLQLLFIWMDFQGAKPSGSIVGLSGLNYALIGLALIFAFDQEIEMLVYVVFVTTFEINLCVLCLLYFLFDFFAILFGGTSWDYFQLVGFPLGIGMGIFLTMSELVPEEGSNLIEYALGVQVGRRTGVQKRQSEKEAEAEELAQDQAEWLEALPNILRLAEEGHFPEVHRRMAKLLSSNQVASWDADLLRKMTQGYTKTGQWDEANRTMEIFHGLYAEQTTAPMWLSWAHIQIELGRPRRALHTLKRLQGLAVRPEQKDVLVKLAQRAKDMIRAGVLEPDSDQP